MGFYTDDYVTRYNTSSIPEKSEQLHRIKPKNLDELSQSSDVLFNPYCKQTLNDDGGMTLTYIDSGKGHCSWDKKTVTYDKDGYEISYILEKESEIIEEINSQYENGMLTHRETYSIGDAYCRNKNQGTFSQVEDYAYDDCNRLTSMYTSYDEEADGLVELAERQTLNDEGGVNVHRESYVASTGEKILDFFGINPNKKA